MTDCLIGQQMVANRRLTAKVSVLEAKIDELMRINTHLRAENAGLKLQGEAAADLGTGLQKGANGDVDVGDATVSPRQEPEGLVDLEKTNPAVFASKEDDSAMEDIQPTAENMKKKKSRSFRPKGGKHHRKPWIPAGCTAPRRITLLTIVSDDSNPNMSTVLRTADDDKVATSTSRPNSRILPTSREDKEEQQSPPNGTIA